MIIESFCQRLVLDMFCLRNSSAWGGEPHLDVVKLIGHLARPSTLSTFPAHFVPIRADGFGNYDCIDLGRSTDSVRSTVVLWQHDAGNDQICSVLAQDFWQWFDGILTMIENFESSA